MPLEKHPDRLADRPLYDLDELNELIDLKRVFQEEDYRCTFEGTLDFSGEELYGAYPFVSPVKIRITAENQERVAALRYTADFVYSRPCDRCLDTAEKSFSLSFEHILAADSEQLSRQLEEIGFSRKQEQGELVIINDYKLDFRELAREDIILEMPTKFLCGENCKGLCPVCGCNLNHSQCGCDTSVPDPRLDALRALLEESGGQD